MAERNAERAEWHQLMAIIDEGIDGYGFWACEAMVLRDAIGARRIGRRVSQRIMNGLHAAGFECDTDHILSESDPLLIRREGAERLATIIAQLLPDIREADRAVPKIATWRDEIVAARAVRHWRPDIDATTKHGGAQSDGPSDTD